MFSGLWFAAVGTLVGIVVGCAKSPSEFSAKSDRAQYSDPDNAPTEADSKRLPYEIQTAPRSSKLLTADVNTPVISSVKVRQDDILPSVAPLTVRGDLSIAGSYAMTPLVAAVSERFIEEGFSGALDIAQMGSGAGFEVFCTENKADVVMASRAMTPSEQQTCSATGRNPISLAVRIDALAIVVSADNSFVKDVTLQELKEIFTADYWSDVRPDWPQELIRRTVPEPGSGALQLFSSEVLEGDLQVLLQATNTNFFSEDEDYLVQALSVDPYAVAFFSYAYYERNQEALQLVSVDGVSPTNKEQYPLRRTLSLYVDENTVSNRPQIFAFLNFFLTHVEEASSQMGYFPLSEKEVIKTKTSLLSLDGEETQEDDFD